MLRFRSSSYHKIDTKGRIIIPSRFKDILKADGTYGVMVTNMNDCLYAYTVSEWDELESRIEKSEGVIMDEFKRFFLGNAAVCMGDKQDRIRIPKELRDYANLEKDIVLVGIGKRFEIWNKEQWDETNKQTDQAIRTEAARKEIASVRL